MYLEYGEYQKMPFPPVEEAEFARLCMAAGVLLDSLTRGFYRYHILEHDHPFRRENFKKALAAQIGWYVEGGISPEETAQPQDVSIGRTKLSFPEAERQEGGAAPQVLRYLQGTGLLGRGLPRC